MSSSTVYRRMKEASKAPDDSPRRRRGPTGAMPDAQMIEVIEQVESCHIGDSPFHGEGHRKFKKFQARLAHTLAYTKLFAHRKVRFSKAHAMNNDLLAFLSGTDLRGPALS